MEILKESTDYLEEKINSTKKEVDEIKDGLDSNEMQIEDANQQLESIDLQIQDIKGKMGLKKNILIASILSVGLLVILAYLFINIVSTIAFILLFALVGIYVPNGYLTFRNRYNELDQHSKRVYERLGELHKINEEYNKKIEYIAKKNEDYTKGLAGELFVTQTLKNLGPDNYLINDVMLHRPYGNIDHILISLHGIFVIETKNWEGEIICNGDNWIMRFEGNFRSIDYQQESLSIRVKGNAAKLSQLIQFKLFKNSLTIWVKGIIVFVNPNVKLSISNSTTVDVLKGENLCKYIEHQIPRTNFSSKDLKSIANFLQKELKQFDQELGGDTQ